MGKGVGEGGEQEGKEREELVKQEEEGEEES